MSLREVMRQFETDGFISTETNYTLSEFIKYWYDNVAILNLRHDSLKLYNGTIKNHIESELGHIPINKVTLIVLQEYFTQKQTNCG